MKIEVVSMRLFSDIASESVYKMSNDVDFEIFLSFYYFIKVDSTQKPMNNSSKSFVSLMDPPPV